MREAIIHRRNNHRARLQQGEDNPGQNYVLFSRLQGRRRAPKFLIICLILCLLTWTISRTSWFPLQSSTEWLPHQDPTQGIVFQMFRYQRYSQYQNMTMTALNTVRRRRERLVLDADNSNMHGETFNEYEHEGQGVEVKPPLQDDQSLIKRKRKPRPAVYYGPYEEVSPSKTRGALGRWPVLGGLRESELDIQPFYVKVPIGSGRKMHNYFLHIDTGSGVTWVMCKGRGPITSVGPNGLFKPNPKSFLDCKKDEDLCKGFQDDVRHPCNSKNGFRCIFGERYGDGLKIKGHVVVDNVCFEAADGSHSHVNIAFGYTGFILNHKYFTILQNCVDANFIHLQMYLCNNICKGAVVRKFCVSNGLVLMNFKYPALLC
ncbi:hypothetical protein KC19_9G111800 [Ceratodon purpureus]|uniref:Xylanase inhibitor N-terminal domain-containing protein n=1 Tax=Ceratodon purpureus TaxID=3225 RepID=A0A8T0GQX5_CERPU|nr:hypothetical protein KC19_9G111800 [Ceratodon purpureus]